jgi:hypothetical protein
MTHPQSAPTIQGQSPLMQFWGRVGDDSAYVRIRRSRLEWSLVGREWVIQMAPMTSITAVSAESGEGISSLGITTLIGFFEFLIEPETADEARMLLAQLVTEAAEHSIAATSSPVADGQVDELINLRWMLEAAVVDEIGHGEAPARLLGF